MFLNLEYEMKKLGYDSASLSELLKISRKAATNRLSGKTAFVLEEILKIKETWFPEKSLEYLFEKNIKKMPARP